MIDLTDSELYVSPSKHYAALVRNNSQLHDDVNHYLWNTILEKGWMVFASFRVMHSTPGAEEYFSVPKFTIWYSPKPLCHLAILKQQYNRPLQILDVM